MSFRVYKTIIQEKKNPIPVYEKGMEIKGMKFLDFSTLESHLSVFVSKLKTYGKLSLHTFFFHFPLEKRHKIYKHPIKTPHQLKRGIASLQENAAELYWVDPLNYSVVQLSFLLHAYCRIPCKSSGEKQTPLLHNYVLLLYPNTLVQITCLPSPPRWKRRDSRKESAGDLPKCRLPCGWKGKDRKKKTKERKGLSQKSPGEWLHLNQTFPSRKAHRTVQTRE